MQSLLKHQKEVDLARKPFNCFSMSICNKKIYTQVHMIVYTCVSDQRGLEIILYMYGSRTFSTSTTIVRDGYTNNDIIYVVFLYL
jgi:hypothetical protein